MLERGVERRADDEHARRPARGLAAQLGEQLGAGDGLVGDHEQPPLARGVRPRRLLDRRLAVAAAGEPPRDRRGLDDEDREPQPAVDRRPDDDQREVADRQPDEPERCLLATERIPHRPGDSLADGGRLEHVDRDVDDDPHHVDEVPVDPADLEPVVFLGAEVPLNERMVIASRIVRPMKTWQACRPVSPKKVAANAVSRC